MNAKESIWIVWLFAIPLVIQVIGLTALYWKPREQNEVRTFYWFYLLTMGFSEVSHLGLWCWYLGTNNRNQWGSTVALIALIVLVSVVIFMTLAIMRSMGGMRPAPEDGHSLFGLLLNWLSEK